MRSFVGQGMEKLGKDCFCREEAAVSQRGGHFDSFSVILVERIREGDPINGVCEEALHVPLLP
jgi:hypothetical protein